MDDAALVCGIVGIIVSPISILAIIFGAIGMGRKNNPKIGKARTGFILGLVGAVILIISIAAYVASKHQPV
jgi:hypothetical protein